MFEPKSFTENVLFSTLQIETAKGVGTAFIFNFISKQKEWVPVIITNKHVLNNKKQEESIFYLHQEEKAGTPSNLNIKIIYQAEWFFHPDPNIDLCCTLLAPILHQVKEKLFFIGTPENQIPSDFALEQLKTVENILMVGYPIGLADYENNLPLIRSGITASHPSVDFNGKAIGVVDIVCFPGSSGSPIFIHNDNGYRDKNGKFSVGTVRTIFLGILYAGPIYKTRGIEIKEIPTRKTFNIQTELMANLGYYIKAREILTLKNELFSKLEII